MIEVGDYVVIKQTSERHCAGNNDESYNRFCHLRDKQIVGVVRWFAEGMFGVYFPKHHGYFIPQRDELQLVDIDSLRQR